MDLTRNPAGDTMEATKVATQAHNEGTGPYEEETSYTAGTDDPGHIEEMDYEEPSPQL